MEGTGRWRKVEAGWEGKWVLVSDPVVAEWQPLYFFCTAPPLPVYVSELMYLLSRGRKEGVAVFSGSHHMVPLLSACVDLSRSLGHS